MHHMPICEVGFLNNRRGFLAIALVVMGYYRRLAEKGTTGALAGRQAVVDLYQRLADPTCALLFHTYALQSNLFIPYSPDTGCIFTPRILAEIDNNASRISSRYVECFTAIQAKFGPGRVVPASSPTSTSKGSRLDLDLDGGEENEYDEYLTKLSRRG
jgi:hypothetical protein